MFDPVIRLLGDERAGANRCALSGFTGALALVQLFHTNDLCKTYSQCVCNKTQNLIGTKAFSGYRDT